MSRRTAEEAAQYRAEEAARIAENKAARAENKRLAESAAEQKRLAKEQDRFELINERTRSIMLIVKDAVDRGSLSDRAYSTKARDIGTCIQDMPAIKSGKISVEAAYKKRVQYNYKPTLEHYYPNQWMGAYMLDYFMEHGYQPSGPGLYDFDLTLVQLIIQARGVHEVTFEENQALRPFQKIGVFGSPEESYGLAGIELIDG